VQFSKFWKATLPKSFKTWAWPYQRKFSDLRNFQKWSENFKPTIFIRKVGKMIWLMFWLGYFIRSLEILVKTVSYEHNQKYWLATLAILKSDKILSIFVGRTIDGYKLFRHARICVR
jgi:hypothetical protein